MFGIDHSFNKIQKYEDFIQLVPSRKYEEIFSYIEKIRNGEENILWPEKTKLFAKSSGTTNARSKYIPLSMTPYTTVILKEEKICWLFTYKILLKVKYLTEKE